MDIITLEIIAILMSIAFLISLSVLIRSNQKETPLKAPYNYIGKQYIMTRAEMEFFKKLEEAAGDRYYIFPQIHLSALLDEKVKGQNWKGAFSHINGKSVDYVLCDKHSKKIAYAIELDDYTHQHPERQKRDREVENILTEAGIKLVRFTNNEFLTPNSFNQISKKAI